ncbi:F-box protein At1g80960-like [Prosopis cineraria]|uniref:F-box protein At1g80960-like n=1 Tax=Prosopis cineraria TaxID=364024 RepID=UPI00241060E6|nr:F-box protein At1g80960-like [Prosopis cineraria]
MVVMTRSRARAKAASQKVDFISQLPVEVLAFIISKLPIDEAVRTSVLSKKWKGIWRLTPHLDIDGKRMIMPLAQRENPEEAYDRDSPLSMALNRNLMRYGLKISVLLIRHSGDLRSSKFTHFPYSLVCEEVVSWVKLVKLKNTKNLSLECELFDIGTFENSLNQAGERKSKPNFPQGIFSGFDSLQFIYYTLNSSEPFEGCENLKTLILKNVYIEDEILNGILENTNGLENFSLIESFGFRKLQIHNPNLKVLQLNAVQLDEIVVFAEKLGLLLLDTVTRPGSLKIYSPNLRVIHSYDKSIIGSILAAGRHVLKASEFLGNYRHFWYSRSDVFKHLSKLSIDLDLNDTQACRLVSTFMRLCTCLETLEITLPIRNEFINRGFYWDLRVACNCIRDHLKFVYLRGYKGNKQEFEFLKHIITKGRKLVRITILCRQPIDQQRLFSLKSASPDLSIILKVRIHSEMQELWETQHRALITYN